MFYACFTLIGSWEGRNFFRVGIFLNKNLLGLVYRKQTTFFFRPNTFLTPHQLAHRHSCNSIKILISHQLANCHLIKCLLRPPVSISLTPWDDRYTYALHCGACVVVSMEILDT